MKSKAFFIIAAALALCSSCSNVHLIGDRDERAAVERDFQARREALSQGRVGHPDGISADGVIQGDISKDRVSIDSVSSGDVSSDGVSSDGVSSDGVSSDRVSQDGVSADGISVDVRDDLFAIFDTKLDTREREALAFLYAYMPLADIADHSGEYFLENVDCAFRTQKEMPWGKLVPEREFRHFVLPVRVNNENLDDSRKVFYEELKDRVKDMSMSDAALEVNHWCHEKVVYRPSDGRTSSPLASVKTAYGRCGEESTFTVAALRSVGIPARQVYTPRWAHTDDNHAWVEAWVDGEWRFFGACEPEPVLNLGWFNAPASRGMLMHTKVFGSYNGPEEVMSSTPLYTEINVTDHYASTARVDVLVTDADGNPVEDAAVEFKVYNYAEFYTVVTRRTDAEGRTSLSAGKGDMLLWAYKDGRFGYSKASFGKDSEVRVVMEHAVSDAVSSAAKTGAGSEAWSFDKKAGVDPGAWSFDKKAGVVQFEQIDIVPPAENALLPEVSTEQRAENDRRMAVEDSIRNAYEATFMSEALAREFALEHGFDSVSVSSAGFRGGEGRRPSPRSVGKETGADVVARFLVASRGNHEEICRFLASLGSAEEKAAGIDLLGQVSSKDLRDVTCEVLDDHLRNTPLLAGFKSRSSVRSQPALNPDYFSKYVRNPRVSNEMLTAYKGFFASAIPPEEQETYRSDPMELVAWTADNIRVDAECNLGGCPISPQGVWRTRTADPHSRDIFFVSVARSLGIPARIDEVTGKVQLLGGDGITDVDFGTVERTAAPTGVLKADYMPISHLSDPRYYSHFSVSRLTPDGSLRLLNYEEGELDMGGGMTWSGMFRGGSSLDAGDYLMVTGTRLAGGGVLATMTFFTVLPGQVTSLDLVMRQSGGENPVIGSFSSESKYTPVDGGAPVSVLSTTGRGYYIVGMLGPGQEPTNHALRDVAALANDFEQWGRGIILLFPDEAQYAKFRPEEFPGLPSTVTFGIDSDGSIMKQIKSGVELSGGNTLPIFIIADTFDRVVFVSQGYTIGLGEQLMNVVNKL